MPAKVAKQQRKSKNNKKQSNKYAHQQNSKKAKQSEKSTKQKKSKMLNGHYKDKINHTETQNGNKKDSKEDLKFHTISNGHAKSEETAEEKAEREKQKEQEMIDQLQRRRYMCKYIEISEKSDL